MAWRKKISNKKKIPNFRSQFCKQKYCDDKSVISDVTLFVYVLIVQKKIDKENPSFFVAKKKKKKKKNETHSLHIIISKPQENYEVMWLKWSEKKHDDNDNNWMILSVTNQPTNQPNQPKLPTNQ